MTGRPDDGDRPTGSAQPQLGERIRALRAVRRMTLTHLAREAGVSPSFLSMLENGKTSIAAPRLQAIAGVFGLDAGDLLPEVGAGGALQVVRRDRRPTVPPLADGAEGSFLARDVRRKIQPVLLRLEPGAQLRNEVGHAGEEFIFVLRGHVRITVGAEPPEDLANGDAASYPSALAHSYENVGSEIAEMMTVSTPPRGP